MNPYLEQERIWQDFHASFVPAMRDSLAEQLLPRYIISVEGHVYVHAPPEPPRSFAGRPDVTVKSPRRKIQGPSTQTALLEAPLLITLPELSVV